MTNEILLIEDSLADADLIKVMLSEVKGQQYTMVHVQYLAQGFDLLRGRSFDVILLGLQDSQGLETVEALRNREKHTPVIVLTSLNDEEMALETLEMDIQDYLIKSEITSSILKRSICYAMGRKRAVEALRESEQRFASFMLHMPAAAWMKDMQGRFVYANAETERAFSTSLPGLLGKTDWDFFPPETARQFAENDCRVLSEGGSLHATEALRQADGIEYYSLVSKFAVAGPDGKPAYIAGVAFDITELKRTEEALRESQRALSTLMSNLPGMAYRCRNDKDWTMEFVSEGCVELTGYQQAGLVQNRKISYAQLIHPDDREGVWNDVQAALQEEKPFKLVYRICTAAGVEKWVWERGRGIFEPDGKLLALEGFIIDITERKKAEEKLEELNANLAERADELKAFNHTVSHDLRSPLNTISASCQAIEICCSDKLDEQCKGFLHSAIIGVDNMSDLIATLLKFAKSAHSELHRETVDLGELAGVITANLRLSDPGRQVTFKIVEGLAANCDPDLLKVVLENLLGNAWKYTSLQSQAVIEFGSAEIDGVKAFIVRDNGPGFSMEDAKDLFVPFKRLPETAELKGHGIGLATVERIIKRHGGKVWAEGEPGKGAAFYFTLSTDGDSP